MTAGRVLFIAIVAALGGILFGYDTAVISGTTRIVADQFLLTELSKGWYVGCALIGSIIGVVSIVSPIYISEVSPAEKRGTLVSLYQLAITIGFLLAYLVNYLVLKGADLESADPALGTRMFNNEYWRGMLGMETIPDLLFLILIFFIPESPRWLEVRGLAMSIAGLALWVGTYLIGQLTPWIDGKKAVMGTTKMTNDQAVSVAQHEKEWNEIFDATCPSASSLSSSTSCASNWRLQSVVATTRPSPSSSATS